jgi:putative endonuclease
MWPRKRVCREKNCIAGRWGCMTRVERKRAQYSKGLLAEQAACGFLMAKGYKIIRQRYKTPVGEIDIIAQKGEVLAIIEVKARNELADALEAVDFRAQRRIENATQHFLMEHPYYAECAIRFDVIAMTGGFLPTHLDNAWQAHT